MGFHPCLARLTLFVNDGSIYEVDYECSCCRQLVCNGGVLSYNFHIHTLVVALFTSSFSNNVRVEFMRTEDVVDAHQALIFVGKTRLGSRTGPPNLIELTV